MDYKFMAGLLGGAMLLGACETIEPASGSSTVSGTETSSVGEADTSTTSGDDTTPAGDDSGAVDDTVEVFEDDGTRRVFAPGVEHLKASEGFVADPYEDVAGYCTIAYGHLIHYDPCTPLIPIEFQDGVTEPEGENLLRSDMDIAEHAVIEEVAVALDDHEFASLVSFTYNVGRANFTSSTLLRLLNEGNYNSVSMEMRRWVYAGGNEVQGLINRRNREIDLFFTNRPVAMAIVMRSSLPAPIDIHTGAEIENMVLAPPDELMRPGATVTLGDLKVRRRIDIETLPDRNIAIERGQLDLRVVPIDRRIVPLRPEIRDLPTRPRLVPERPVQVVPDRAVIPGQIVIRPVQPETDDE